MLFVLDVDWLLLLTLLLKVCGLRYIKVRIIIVNSNTKPIIFLRVVID
jgi:hypothetical protein